MCFLIEKFHKIFLPSKLRNCHLNGKMYFYVTCSHCLSKNNKLDKTSWPLKFITVHVNGFYPGAWRLKVILLKIIFTSKTSVSNVYIRDIYIPTSLCGLLLHLWECMLWVSCKIKPDFRKYRFALHRGEVLHSPFPPCFPRKRDTLLHNLFQAPTAGREAMCWRVLFFYSDSKPPTKVPC